MNISEIAAKPCYERKQFKDYPVSMRDILELTGVKNWIYSTQRAWTPEQLIDKLMGEGEAYVRVRFTGNGTILSMDISQYGVSSLAVFSYVKGWDDVVKIIERNATNEE